MTVYFTMRLVAPVASLQAPRIDTISNTLPIPSRSMIAGMIGAALGLGYHDHGRLQALQDAIRLGAVVHREGVVERDFQTIRMGLPHMVGPMWWHDGQQLGTMERAGGDPERGLTGERPLTCDIDITLVIELSDDAPFAPEAILDALDRPAFPLGIGQRSCLPTEPVSGELLKSASMDEALTEVWSRRAGAVYLPVSVQQPGQSYVSVPAGRNWRTRQHGGTDTYAVAQRA